MDRSNILTLVAFSSYKDEIGQIRNDETYTVVPCKVNSVTRSEWAIGGQQGLNPEYQCVIFQGDYNGEKECILEGTRYSIYRTYMARNDDLELYLTEKVGATYGDEN